MDGGRRSVDVLVFGPHPDDIEIGLGGTIARHVAAGHRVGLCDLTAGELSSNGTPAQRRAEAADAATVLGAAWRENLGWPDGGDRADAGDDSIGGRSDPARAPAHGRRAVLGRSPSRSRRQQPRAARRRCSPSGLRRYESADEAWRPDWVCYYFINDGATPSFVVDVSAHYQRKRDALDCYRSQFAPREDEAVATRLTAATFRQLIESRDAQFGALAGVAFAEGIVVREPIRRSGLLKHAP